MDIFTSDMPSLPFLRDVPNEVLQGIIGESLCSPIEARAQIIHEPLSRVLFSDLAREIPCLLQVGQLGLEPEHVGVRREGLCTLDRCLHKTNVEQKH